MNNDITKKTRGTHDGIKRKVILVVTDDRNLAVGDVYRDLDLSHEEITVQIIRSTLTGKPLDLAVKRYMQEHQVFISRGDRIIYYQKRRECL